MSNPTTPIASEPDAVLVNVLDAGNIVSNTDCAYSEGDVLVLLCQNIRPW